MNIAVFCGSHLGRNPHFESAAQDFGRLIAQRGNALVYGGSNKGYMGTVSSAALAGGGKVIGIIPTFFSPEIIHSQKVSELVLVETLAQRKELMAERSDAFVAMAGGIGTVDEVSEILAYNQLGRMNKVKPMGILNTDGFYNPLVEQFRIMKEEGLFTGVSYDSLVVADTPEEMMEKLEESTEKLGQIEVLKTIR